MKAQCPECDAWVQVPGSIELWDTVICAECDTELQIISLDPLELDYADFEEDDDDDEDEDY
jgi:alpha-aminoadipate carrier protein LysW